MPIIWRYLLTHYFKVLFLCSFAFIALLLTLRLTEIASFIALGANSVHVAYFALRQIPYILPIALPISALISAMILLRHLSKTQELTALRSGGMSLWNILTPLLFAGTFLSIVNFYVVSEMATDSHLNTALIKSEMRSINPLQILRNKHFTKVCHLYFDTLGPSKAGESASDALIAMPSQNGEHIDLLVAKKLSASEENFSSEYVTLISELYVGEKKECHLCVENLGKTKTSIRDFSLMWQRKHCSLNSDHLQMPFLLGRLDDAKQQLERANILGKPASSIKQYQRGIVRIYTEMMRRFSLAIAVFTFTLVGAAFGLTIGRKESHRGLAAVVALAALYIAAYFSAKGIDHLFYGSMIFYFLPHILLIGAAFWNLKKVTRGIE